MPDAPLIKNGKVVGVISFVGDYKPGDPPPSGYNDWHEWARIQHKGGLNQTQCPMCSTWRFPQEMENHGCDLVAYRKRQEEIRSQPLPATRPRPRRKNEFLTTLVDHFYDSHGKRPFTMEAVADWSIEVGLQPTPTAKSPKEIIDAWCDRFEKVTGTKLV